MCKYGISQAGFSKVNWQMVRLFQDFRLLQAAENLSSNPYAALGVFKIFSPMPIVVLNRSSSRNRKDLELTRMVCAPVLENSIQGRLRTTTLLVLIARVVGLISLFPMRTLISTLV